MRYEFIHSDREGLKHTGFYEYTQMVNSCKYQSILPKGPSMVFLNMSVVIRVLWSTE